MHPWDFWNYTPHEFSLAVAGFNEHFELRERLNTERARNSTFLNISPHIPKNTHITIEKMWPTKWDNEFDKALTTNVTFVNDPKVKERMKQYFATASNN